MQGKDIVFSCYLCLFLVKELGVARELTLIFGSSGRGYVSRRQRSLTEFSELYWLIPGYMRQT